MSAIYTLFEHAIRLVKNGIVSGNYLLDREIKYLLFAYIIIILYINAQHVNKPEPKLKSSLNMSDNQHHTNVSYFERGMCFIRITKVLYNIIVNNCN